jgi:hypothetical protein
MKNCFYSSANGWLLDLAGTVQVFTEDKFYGSDIDIAFYTYQQQITIAAGIAFRGIDYYKREKVLERYRAKKD